LETILNLHQMGVKTCVLTARGQGMGLAGGRVQGTEYGSTEAEAFFANHIDGMKAFLNTKEGLLQSWYDNGGLKLATGEMTEEELPEYNMSGASFDSDLESDPCMIVMKDHFIFGGTSCRNYGQVAKGRVADHLLEANYFGEPFKNFMFVDDQTSFTSNFKKTFERKKRTNEKAFVFNFVR